jgi:hypothetical protein
LWSFFKGGGFENNRLMLHQCMQNITVAIKASRSRKYTLGQSMLTDKWNTTSASFAACYFTVCVFMCVCKSSKVYIELSLLSVYSKNTLDKKT